MSKNPSPQHHLLVQDLRLNIKGDVLSDHGSLGMYATDASLYQIIPVAIVLPKDEEDVTKAVEIAVDHGISILPRGGGTSLAGQTVGRSMILDFSKYMNKIIEFNEAEKWIRVQPGLVRDELNNFLKKYNLQFAPDPATSSRANVGGMIGNNSSGTKSILYGKTVDHVLALKIVLTDGSIINLKECGAQDLKLKEAQTDREGEIYRKVHKIIAENETEIIDAFPKVMRRVQGYNLDELAGKTNWNLAKIICGSEGTLATILEAKINLVPFPKFKSLCVVHFEDMHEAIRAVQPMLEYRPSAIEILDDTVLKMSQENLTTQRHSHFIKGSPAAVQIVEFYGDKEEDVLSRPKEMVDQLKQLGLGYAYPIYPEGPTYDDVWIIRKKGLGLMLGVKGDKKALPFIEDASIPIEVLPEYIEKVVSVCTKYNTKAAVYAHASVGVIHVRPILDMRLEEDIHRFKKISEETFELVKHYKGSWSGEHGDGLVRSFYLERYFGERVYGALKSIKNLFDPLNLMNPGKIIDAPSIDQNLRYGSSYEDQSLETIFHYRDDGSFQNAVHMCTGVGECRKISGGTMCPSYKATRDEEHSTRGRANALRLAMSGQLDTEGLTSPRLKEALDLCLSCKACKSECPSNVDMAKLKSEVLQKNYDVHGISLRDRMIKYSSILASRISGPLAPLVNRVLSLSITKYLLEKSTGFDKRRNTPKYSSTSFVNWYNSNYKTEKAFSKKVVLFADTYLNYHEPEIGIAAVNLLHQLDFDVLVADVGCCQRPGISHGFLKDAKAAGTRVASKLEKYINEGYDIVVCEPSCYSSLVDDLPDLLDDTNQANKLKSHVYSLEEYVANELNENNIKFICGGSNRTLQKVLIHGHCHQKALTGTDKLKFIFDSVSGIQVEEIPSGCCGMAGSFGYEKEHYEISKNIANDILIPAISTSNKETVVVANGFSCRHQISDFAKRKSSHWVKAFYDMDVRIELGSQSKGL